SSGSRLLRGPPDVIFPNSLMSAPATNVRPPPMTTAALTAASLLISSIAAQIPSGTPGLRAFTGGLSMVMTATSLSLLTFTRLFIWHPNEALQLQLDLDFDISCAILFSEPCP